MRRRSRASTMFRGMVLRSPATRWEDALPCGNGTIGALVYGSIAHERILCNHEALWLRSEKRTVPKVSCHLPALRKLLGEGRYGEAQDFMSERLAEAGYPPTRHDPYHPAFDLLIDMVTSAAFTSYRRTLDFTTGEAVVTWTEGDTGLERRLFVSRADEAIVLAIRGDKPLSLTVWLAPHENLGRRATPEKPPVTFTTSAEADGHRGWLAIVGRNPNETLYPEGPEFGGVARITATAGSVSVAEGKLRLHAAQDVTIVLKLFANEASGPAIPRLHEAIEALDGLYEPMFRRHAELHRELFERVALSLSTEERRNEANELLLLEAYEGAVPSSLIERMHDYGRYLLLSSSGPGGLPANLQGIWNGDWNPPWESDFHNDENIQMNYWQALPGNLAETTLPFFDYYESMLDDYRENARQVYGCRGILAPVSQSTNGLMYTGPWVNWTGGAGWLGQLFYDYWLFTGDVGFLRHRAVPFLKEVARFYEDFLFEGPDRTLVFSPSLSPENIPARPGASHAQINATMDIAIAREVLTNLVSGCELLGIEKAGVRRWRSMLGKLPDYSVNPDGAIAEWVHPDLPDNYHHRHLSHLYPLFPGFEVTRETDPDLFEACRVAVEKRLVIGLSSQSGWSYAHMANIYARLGDGDRALECLELLTRSCVGPNLVTYHNDWRGQGLTVSWFGPDPPFQIDANFGFAAAVLEMLAFSRPGLVKLLPALPGKWDVGSVQGICCRGGIVVSLAWDMTRGRVEAKLRSETKQEVTLGFPAPVASLKCVGAAPRESARGAAYRQLELPPGRNVTLRAVLRRV